jgi:hypothetical protein
MGHWRESFCWYSWRLDKQLKVNFKNFWAHTIIVVIAIALNTLAAIHFGLGSLGFYAVVCVTSFISGMRIVNRKDK